MTPDLICVLDTVSGEAIGTEDRALRPARDGGGIARTRRPPVAKGLAHVGPRAFGYDIDFTSVFTS